MLDDLNAAYDAGIEKGIWVPMQFNDYETLVVPVRKALLHMYLARRGPSYEYVETIRLQLIHNLKYTGIQSHTPKI